MTGSCAKLIVHTHLLSMSGSGVGYIEDGAVAVDDDIIAGVGPTSQLQGRFQAEEIIDATGHVLMPGLIDAHMHTPFTLMRGVAQDIHHWLQKGLAPYAKHLSHNAMLAGTRLAIAEAIQCGTTTFGDYVHPYPGWAEAFQQAGVRARLTPMINALPEKGMAGWKLGEVYPLDDDKGQKSIDVALEFADRWNDTNRGKTTVMLGPQGPDMLSKAQLMTIKQEADNRGLMLHLHTAQGVREIEQMLKRYGARTPDYLDRLGYLDDQLLAVHLTEATDRETELIAKRGANMALCSGSIGIIDGIVPPAQVFREAGGNVALGSDQASGNNCHNVFFEMRATALFNKIKFRDPTMLPAWQALRMATIEGARAIGMGEDIGSIEEGKQADLILVDMSHANLQPLIIKPVRNIVPNLVYAASGNEVSDSMVAGQWIMRKGKPCSFSLEDIRENAQIQAKELSRRICVDPAHQKLALMQQMAKGQL